MRPYDAPKSCCVALALALGKHLDHRLDQDRLRRMDFDVMLALRSGWWKAPRYEIGRDEDGVVLSFYNSDGVEVYLNAVPDGELIARGCK